MSALETTPAGDKAAPPRPSNFNLFGEILIYFQEIAIFSCHFSRRKKRSKWYAVALRVHYRRTMAALLPHFAPTTPQI
jgi:hypothetical protein